MTRKYLNKSYQLSKALLMIICMHLHALHHCIIAVRKYSPKKSITTFVVLQLMGVIILELK